MPAKGINVNETQKRALIVQKLITLSIQVGFFAGD